MRPVLLVPLAAVLAGAALLVYAVSQQPAPLPAERPLQPSGDGPRLLSGESPASGRSAKPQVTPLSKQTSFTWPLPAQRRQQAAEGFSQQLSGLPAQKPDPASTQQSTEQSTQPSTKQPEQARFTYEQYKLLVYGITRNEAEEIMGAQGTEVARTAAVVKVEWRNPDRTGCNATFDLSSKRLRHKANDGLIAAR